MLIRSCGVGFPSLCVVMYNPTERVTNAVELSLVCLSLEIKNGYWEVELREFCKETDP